MTSCARGAPAVLVPPRPARRRPLRAVASALIVGATLLGPWLAGPAAAGASPAVTADGLPPVRVAVTSVSPRVVQPGQDLTLTATLTNTGTGTLGDPHVLVHLDRRGFVTRTALDRWRQADPMADAGPAVLEVGVPGPLGPGASATVVATVPASSLGLRSTATSWGARGLALEVVDHADPARRRQGIARTFALWFPQQEVAATEVTVVVPVVGPAVDPGSDAWAGDLEALTAPGGRLAEVLRGTADHREVTWVLDPWLVDATTGATSSGGTGTGPTPSPSGSATPPTGTASPSPTASPTPASEAPTAAPTVAPPVTAAPTVAAGPDATAWAAALLRATTGRDVRLLPYGDPDVVALAHAGARDILDRATSRAKAVADASGLPHDSTSTIAWPGVDLPDLTTAAFLGRDGTRTLIVGPGTLAPPEGLTYTPTGKTTLSTAAGDVTALIPDDRLSTALRTGLVETSGTDDERAAAKESEAAWHALATAQLTGATAGQDLLAELAVITRERPSDTRRLLLTVPRDWQPDGDVLDAQLTALSSAPWVRPESVSTLIGAPDPDVKRGTLPARAALPAEVSSSTLDALLATVTERAALATMVPDPALLTGDLDRELLAPLSVAWRAEPEARDAVIEQAGVRTQALKDAVAVDPGTVLTLVSTTGGLPVRLRNSLAQPVTVSVTLQTGNGRLRADAPVKVTVPAHGEQTALIPVHAIQSADLQVGVELRTPDGTLVDADTALPVRVRAEWEGIGTAVVAGVLAVGLVIGLIRTIRRGRTSRRAAPVVAGPDALSPEEKEAADEEALGGAGSDERAGSDDHAVSP
ncbi:MAG TPA: DUF6049 family protein [Actinotalea sp.]